MTALAHESVTVAAELSALLAAPPACPEPGVYPDVDFQTYLGWPALNQSGAKRLLRSPAHYKAEADDESKSKARGTVCHAGIWEPARFDELYAIGPDVDLRTKGGKAEWEAFCAANPNRFHVRGADGAAMLGIRRSIWSHRNARKLLGAAGPCELSIVWDDPETGVRCKGRIDKHAVAASAVTDLKTTTDARTRKFAKTCAEFSYHVQGAFNLHGMTAVGLPVETFYLIAAETSDPYAVMVYELDDDAIEAGRRRMVEAMELYRDCVERDRWPAYDDTALKLALPDWC